MHTMNDINNTNDNLSQPPSWTPAPPPAPPAHKAAKPAWLIVVLTLASVLVVGGVAAGIAVSASASDSSTSSSSWTKDCKVSIGKFVDSLTDLDAQLDVGMNQGDYNDELRDIASVRNDLDESSLSEQCTNVLDDADTVYDTYRSVSTEWEDCIWADYCDPDTDVDFTPWDQNGTLLTSIKERLAGKPSAETDSDGSGSNYNDLYGDNA
jgi:hypothetical protein